MGLLSWLSLDKKPSRPKAAEERCGGVWGPARAPSPSAGVQQARLGKRPSAGLAGSQQ